LWYRKSESRKYNIPTVRQTDPGKLFSLHQITGISNPIVFYSLSQTSLILVAQTILVTKYHIFLSLISKQTIFLHVIHPSVEGIWPSFQSRVGGWGCEGEDEKYDRRENDYCQLGHLWSFDILDDRRFFLIIFVRCNFLKCLFFKFFFDVFRSTFFSFGVFIVNLFKLYFLNSKEYRVSLRLLHFCFDVQWQKLKPIARRSFLFLDLHFR
jgi:hypothetical protein